MKNNSNFRGGNQANLETTPQSKANPFYNASRSHSSPSTTPKTSRAYARLPRAPRTASPVPHLTSLYHFRCTGEYGDRSYPGNCSGNLIKDLLLYFRSRSVFDPMTGSGTCRDVCRELATPCLSMDLKSGFDATAPQSYVQFSETPGFDFVWAHPPYWRQKVYSNSSNDMSCAPTLDTFLESYGLFIQQCSRLLSPTGKFAILMGDYRDREAGFVPLVFHTKRLAFEAGLKQATTDIIRFSHGASSSRRTYRSSFIPGLHDVCMIFERKS